MATCIVRSIDDKRPLAPLASCAASVDTPTPSPYATDSRSFQLPITVPWHHGSNRVCVCVCLCAMLPPGTTPVPMFHFTDLTASFFFRFNVSTYYERGQKISVIGNY